VKIHLLCCSFFLPFHPSSFDGHTATFLTASNSTKLKRFPITLLTVKNRDILLVFSIVRSWYCPWHQRKCAFHDWGVFSGALEHIWSILFCL